MHIDITDPSEVCVSVELPCTSPCVYKASSVHEPGTISNTLSAKLYHFNFHPLEVVSHCCNPQFQVGDIYSDLSN